MTEQINSNPLVENAKLDSIHHIAIHVADLSASIKWYQTSFNCELICQERQFARLRFANIELVLTLPSSDPAHLAFAREDATKLGTLRERADGLMTTFLSDPTGNTIEIIGRLHSTTT